MKPSAAITLVIVAALGPQNANVHPVISSETVAVQEAARADASRAGNRGTTAFLGQFEESLARRLKSAGRSLTNSTVAAGAMRSDARFLLSFDSLLYQIHTQVLHSNPVPAGQFQQVVALVGQNGLMCSGTLISPTAVLTAAHCACRKATDFVVFGNVSSGTRVPASRTVPMATDCSGTSYQQDDIALTFLPAASTVPFQALADLAWIKQPGSATIVGFGETGLGGTGRKQFADTPVVSRDCTGPNDVSSYKCISGREVVTGGFLRPDVCDGDSGGPLLVTGPDQKLYLAATISRVVSACGTGSIYERLDQPRLDWIAKQGVTVHVGP